MPRHASSRTGPRADARDGRLLQVADLFLRADRDRAARQGDLAGRGPEQRRLAAAVGADQGPLLPGLDAPVDGPEDAGRAAVHRRALQEQGGAPR